MATAKKKAKPKAAPARAVLSPELAAHVDLLRAQAAAGRGDLAALTLRVSALEAIVAALVK